ncbi:MAG: transporter [Ekhidna sp.]|uniref:transporter n=1 Tax=Ekhidna sp. TaxID=2608089 RepID=UPI0032EF6ECE
MRKSFVIILFLSVAAVFAQDSNPIITDRPTQSAASTVVPLGTAIVEYGFIHESAGDFSTTTFANLHARVGLLKYAELRITQNIQQVKNDATDTKLSGLSPITLGAKVHLITERGAMPQTSIIGQMTLENGNEAFRPSKPVPEVRLNFSNTLGEFWSLGYNVGMQFPENNTITLYTAVIGYSFLPGWTAFAEPYGFFYEGDSDHRFNAGIIYLVKNNFQVDISAGVGLSDISPDSFIGLGAAIGF